VKPKICLGTAQFGLPYGITNETGKVAELEVRTVLRRASLAHLTFLDTAQAYGDAETVLGRTLPAGHSFKLISKLRPQSQTSFTIEDRLVWEKNFECSLLRMRVPSVEALLIHNVGDLLKPGGEYLREWLLSLRMRGLVRRLGVSIYESCDLDGVPPELLDLVQLPLSLYDQRLLADGTISRLRAQGCAVHARSLYLQGLLLSPIAAWPKWVDRSVCEHHAKLENLASNRDCTLLQCALGFATAQEDLEAVVIGLCSVSELEQLLLAWESSSPWHGSEWAEWSLRNYQILDPRNWPDPGS